MAGTDRRRDDAAAPEAAGGPAVILVRPQLGVNIGTAARAMVNCGLSELRLVAPRDGWPSDYARKAAAGADAVLDAARIFDSTAAAIADLQHVWAASARRRDMIQTTMTPRSAAVEMRAQAAAGGRVGVLFGPERSGLDNDDIVLAERVIEAPLNPAYASLNLAQAVLLIGYEWFVAGLEGAAAPPPVQTHEGGGRPATRAELQGLFEHLEGELDAHGFLRVIEKRPIMVRNIRNIFQRAGLMEQEVRTLRGVIASLVGPRRGGERDGDA